MAWDREELLKRNPYNRLVALFATYYALTDAQMRLLWDVSTGQLPGKCGSDHEGQIAAIETQTHALMEEALPLCDQVNEGTLEDLYARANLREMREKATREVGCPSDVAIALSKASATCIAAWGEAREQDNFGIVAPHLEEVFDLTRKKGEAMAAQLNVSPYEALLSVFQPGVTGEQVERISRALAAQLPDIRDRAIARYVGLPKPLPLFVGVRRYKAMKIYQELGTKMGINWDRARLDIGPHPSTFMTNGQARMTTFFSHGKGMGLLGSTHEFGHGLYALAVRGKGRAYQAVGQDRGIGVHETQSMIMEVIMARGPWFAHFLSKWLGDKFGLCGPAYTAKNIMRNFQAMRFGGDVRRVMADPLHYQAHIALRMELERSILDRKLRVKDLPDAWHEASIHHLGVPPTSQAAGVLQDPHWYKGMPVYWACYILGAVGAAQMWEGMLKDRRTLPDEIMGGDFSGMNIWLTERVRQHESFYTTDDLMTRAVGTPWDPKPLLDLLEARYVRGEG